MKICYTFPFLCFFRGCLNPMPCRKSTGPAWLSSNSVEFRGSCCLSYPDFSLNLAPVADGDWFGLVVHQSLIQSLHRRSKLSREGAKRIQSNLNNTDISLERYNFDRIPSSIRGSQWGGGIYGYRLKSWLFYGYRLIFFQLRLTKELKINCFSFKKLNIN